MSFFHEMKLDLLFFGFILRETLDIKVIQSKLD